MFPPACFTEVPADAQVDNAPRQSVGSAQQANIHGGAPRVPLPQSTYNQWRTLELTIDPSGLGV